jgi:protein-S-isoprenylcysteine O-methyltransferase Ste14
MPSMKPLELKIPPPAVAVIVAFLMWGISRITAPWEIPALARGALVLVIAASGVSFSVSGFTTFRRAKTTINPRTPEAASALVSSGVYRITRNPMYLGLLLVLVAWAVFLSSAWALAGPAVFLIYIQLFQITPEERVLFALFGTEYSAYKAKVRRWL